MGRLSGKTAVTGGSTGIGRAPLDEQVHEVCRDQPRRGSRNAPAQALSNRVKQGLTRRAALITRPPFGSLLGAGHPKTTVTTVEQQVDVCAGQKRFSGRASARSEPRNLNPAYRSAHHYLAPGQDIYRGRLGFVRLLYAGGPQLAPSPVPPAPVSVKLAWKRDREGQSPVFRHIPSIAVWITCPEMAAPAPASFRSTEKTQAARSRVGRIPGPRSLIDPRLAPGHVAEVKPVLCIGMMPERRDGGQNIPGGSVVGH